MAASTLASPSSRHHLGVIRVVPETDRIVAVCLEGDIDLVHAPTLGDQIDRALDCAKALIFDLSEATFIDSSVIHVLFRASKVALDRKQTVVLQLGTDALVERVLELVRIERALPRVYERDEAVRIIQRQAQTV